MKKIFKDIIINEANKIFKDIIINEANKDVLGHKISISILGLIFKYLAQIKN